MGDEDETIRARLPAGTPLDSVLIRVIEGRGVGLQAELRDGGSLGVGQSSDNDLCLQDVLVSRYHAELSLRQGSVEVRDLDSTNGTYVGTVRVSHAFVRVGTVLVVGTNALLVTTAPAARAHTKVDPDGVHRLPGVVAESPAMRAVARSIAQLVSSDVNVLLHGESGTGKEVLARALHDLGPRRGGPFEVVDCGSMAASLIASELFGHERGAFTGAVRRHRGAFERATGGTILLDEIGELPLDLQPILLGVLERRRFRRVGGAREQHVDLRVVAATHRDLRKATNRGTFRADLYFRLAVARIVVPPLRARPEDIEPLVRHFVGQLTGDPNTPIFDNQTLRAFEAMPWTGNVRELRNMIEGAMALGPSAMAQTATRQAIDGSGRAPGGDVLERPYREARAAAIASFERAYLQQLLDGAGGNVSMAARYAEMDRHYLLRLLRKHGLR